MLLQLAQILAIVILVTGSEGGMNTTFPPYLNSLDVSISRIGFIVSLFGVAQLLARLPSGALYSGRRAKALMASALVLLFVSTAGFALNGHALTILALTLLHGFAFGAVTTIMLALAIEVKPDGYSPGAVMGWYTAALSAGYALGNSLGGFLAEHLGFRLVFLIFGVFPLAAGLLVLALPRIGTAGELAARPAGERGMSDGQPVAQAPGLRSSRGFDLGQLPPALLLATLAAFYINFLDDAVGAFFPLFGLSIGLSLTTIGTLNGIKSLTATGIRPVSGFFFKFVDSRLLIHVAILIWSLMIVFFPVMRHTWVFFLAFIAIGLSRGLIRVASATMVAEEKSRRPEGLGLASGVYNAGLDLGAFAGPAAGGLLASAMSIPAMFRVVPLGLVVAYFLAVFLVTRTEKRAAKAFETTA